MKDKKKENKVQTTEDIRQDANTQNIERHKKAAAHHIEAAKHHLEAAKNHQVGHHDKAAQNTVLAYGHSAIAGEFLNDDAKHHAQEIKQTKYK